MNVLPHFMIWTLALAGAVFALVASLGKILGFLNASWANKITLVAYLLMGLSILIFVIRGFGGG